MKAIIPVAGAGVQLRPHTYTQPKPLILVAGKPIISFIIDQLHEAGVNEFVFVLGYLGDKIKDYLNKAYPGLSMEFVYQEVRRGLGDAILQTKNAIKDEDEVVILLGDTILDMDIVEFLGQDCSSLAIHRVQDPRMFGVVEIDDDRVAKRVVEKPSIPKSNLAIVGLYKIREVGIMIEALENLAALKTNTEYELHLTDAIMGMINRGVKFSTYEVRKWYDCGRKDILLETNQVLLQQQNQAAETQYAHDHSIIIPPVVFGKSCNFKNSIIGPNVTLGDHVTLEETLLKNSIIGNYVEIKGAVLRDSVVGNDTVIKGLSQSLNIGDNNEIDFTQ